MKSNPLLINGSPNKSGYSMQVAKAVFNLQETDILHAYDLTVHACDDCKYCHHKLACKFKDDMDAVKAALMKTDTLIIVSPIYFGALTDKLMRIINRFQSLFEAKFTHKKPFTTLKNIYLITTAASTEDKMFQGATLTVDILASLFSVETPKTLALGGTDDCDDIIAMHKTKITSFKDSV